MADGVLKKGVDSGALTLLQRMADAVEAVRPERKFPRNMKKVRVPGGRCSTGAPGKELKLR